MSPEIKESINIKMHKLEEFTKLLDEYKRDLSLKEFESNSDKHYAVMYLLTLSIEAVTDVGAYILSKGFHERRDTYRDILKTLAEKKVIDEKLAKESEGMTDFRNLLIHIYEKVDLKEVFDVLQKAPAQFREYARFFQKYLDKFESE